MDYITSFTYLSSYDYPNPAIRTLQMIHKTLDQEYGLQLKDDFKVTLDYINNEQISLQKLYKTSIALTQSMNQASKDKLYAIKYRYEEISILLEIQHIKRFSIEYNSKLNCTYLHSKVHSNNVQQKLLRPEHFERPQISQQLPKKLSLHGISNQQQYQEKLHAKLHNELVKAHYHSPWDGSEFKYQMVLSLHEKYKKKIIFDLFVCYRTMNMNINQVITSYLRLRIKRIVQICFSSILADALLSRYTLFANEVKLYKLFLRKYKLPVFQRLFQYHRMHMMHDLIMKKACVFQQSVLHRYGWELLLWNKRYMKLTSIFVKWSLQRCSEIRKRNAFYAWILSYINKNILRKQLIQRYNINNRSYISNNHNNHQNNEDCLFQNILTLIRNYSLQNLNDLRSLLQTHYYNHHSINNTARNNHRCYTGSMDCSEIIRKLSISIKAMLQLSIQSKQLLPKLPFQFNSNTSVYNNSEKVNDSTNANNEDYQPISEDRSTANSWEEKNYFTRNKTRSTPVSLSTQRQQSYSQTIHAVNGDIINDQSVQGSKLFNDALESSFNQSSSHKSTFCRISQYDSSSDNECDGHSNNQTAQRLHSFRMIKFHWLIKMSRKFIRLLRRDTKLQKYYYHCRNKIKRKYIFKIYWRKWKMLYQKQMKSIYICEHIYMIKLLKRLVREWYLLAIERFHIRKDIIHQFLQKNRLKHTYKLWLTLYRDRMHLISLQKQLALYKLKRILKEWKIVIHKYKRMKKATIKIRRKLLMPWFNAWHRKYRKRTLLIRVFTIQKNALIWRYLQQPNTFTRLYSNFHAWSSYTIKQSHIRNTQSVKLKVLYFRAASLLARHFVVWCKYIENRNEQKLYIKTQNQLRTRWYFTLWIKYMKQHKQFMHKIIEYSQHKVKRFIYNAWKSWIYYHTMYLPYEYFAHNILRKCFDYWRTMKPFNRLYDTCNHQVQQRMILAKRFKIWRNVYTRSLKYRHGFNLLSRCFYNNKKRLIFMNWPGRKEAIRARYLLQVFQQQRNVRKTRSRLVDQLPPPVYVKPMITSTISFIQKKRPSLLERAMSYGYVDNELDYDSLYYYQDLLKAMLYQWSRYSKAYVKVRNNGYKLRAQSDINLVRKALRQWIFHTPCTSHRCVVWLIKPIYRAHDEYCRLQEKEMKTQYYQQQQQPPLHHYKIKTMMK